MVKNGTIKSNINILGGFEGFDRIPDLLGATSLSLNERTEASAKRYLNAINETFNKFHSKEVELLFKAALQSRKLSEEAKKRVMALQFIAGDPLFQSLFIDCFIPVVNSGRITISKHDVIAYIDENIRLDTLNVTWSRETIDTVSRKFLSVLKKLNFLDGKVKKTLVDTYTGPDFLVFFHYWLQAFNETSNALTSRFFPLLMVSKEKYLFLLKQEAIRNKIDWSYSGDKVQVSTKLTLDEYADELSNRLR
ncbi:hypothetical protein [Larkinella sp. C7]|uniref:hypothetical protein n=1 Tax=Larkinella sp. C7 TaxID=2576607 RepID=UPI00111129B5|nr:hypothetical protein [Larkinella sp. C7]